MVSAVQVSLYSSDPPEISAAEVMMTALVIRYCRNDFAVVSTDAHKIPDRKGSSLVQPADRSSVRFLL